MLTSNKLGLVAAVAAAGIVTLAGAAVTPVHSTSVPSAAARGTPRAQVQTLRDCDAVITDDLGDLDGLLSDLKCEV